MNNWYVGMMIVLAGYMIYNGLCEIARAIREHGRK